MVDFTFFKFYALQFKSDYSSSIRQLMNSLRDGRNDIIYQIILIFFDHLEIDDACGRSSFSQRKRSAVVEK